jgi:hypothetical protein
MALVKIADGFNDPVNATSAKDGMGRIFVVERVGRIKLAKHYPDAEPSTGRDPEIRRAPAPDRKRQPIIE